MPWFVLLSACAILDLLRDDTPPPNCDPRTAYYPDVDHDGIGEATDLYVGCEAPEGWVTTNGDTAETAEETDTDTDAS